MSEQRDAEHFVLVDVEADAAGVRRPKRSVVYKSQYTAIRYAERLADAGALASIGRVGDSYDNAKAESLIGLYRNEMVKAEGPWKGVDDLELATLNWVHWFNNKPWCFSRGLTQHW